jgi:uncharacterized glyoxalase superfamily protein PhnB
MAGIPAGYGTVTPYLTVKGAAKAIDFYRAAFGAQEHVRMPGPDGAVMHAELRIGTSNVMLSDEFPMEGVARCPSTLGGTTVTVHLYVEDVDAAHRRAVDAGATSLFDPTDMFWGDRFAKVQDPYGHHWSIATHVRDVSPDEMRRGMAEFQSGCES